MSLVDVLKKLQEKNISISLDGDQLKVNAAKGAMTKELMQLLKQNKEALLSWAKQQQNKADNSKPIPQRDNNKPLKLSFSQQRLWFVEQLAPGNATYNVPAAIVLTGSLNTDILQQVLNTLIQRHEALRTSFIDNDGDAEQIIHNAVHMPIQVEHCDYALADKDALLALAADELLKPFDLSQAPLFRVRVLKLRSEEQDQHLLLLNLHHIITDGWSNGILLQEIAQCYAAISQHKIPSLPDVQVQYADYAQWQQEQLSVEQLQEKTLWWKEQLADVAILELPIDHSRPAQKSGRGGLLKFQGDEKISQGMATLTSHQGCTAFIGLLSAYQVLLNRLTGQSDICIGTPSANRHRPEVQNTLGFFVNTLALRTKLTDSLNFNELLALSNKVFIDANDHQDVPFESIVDSLGLSREMSSTAIFQTMISYQKGELQKSFALEHLNIEALEVETHTAKFDLTLGILETDAGYAFSFEYDSDIFSAATIQSFADYYLQLLENIIQQPANNIHQLDILSSAQKQQLIQQGQGPVTNYPKAVNLAHQVEQWAIKTPDAIAAEFDQLKISYQQLDQQASQFAHQLKDSGFCRGDILALTLQRSPEMLIAILAAVKAGGIYLPIDPNYPDDRIKYMLEDSQAKSIICDASQLIRLKGLLKNSTLASRLIDLDQLQQEAASRSRQWKTEPDNNQGQDGAYLMYTSGSTGQPKGVLIPQAGVSRLAVNTNMCTTTSSSRIAHVSNVAFDAAALEIWTALLNGACLVGIKQDDLLDGQRFGEIIQEKDISFLLLTVALFNVFVSENPAIFANIDYLFAGGEAVDIHKINAVLAAKNSHGEPAAPKHLINAYGPTENSCISSFYEITETQTRQVPIGSAISNSSCYILDAFDQLCPPGISGELCTAGDGLAIGYLNKPEQTAAAFITHPFKANEKLYRTGDICRWNTQGEIDILGRIDEQIKLRGFRIELDEINRHLGLVEGIKEAAVVVRDTGHQYLAAYIVAEGIDSSSDDKEAALQFIQKIKTVLGAQLPHYMVPQAFEFMPALPISANGKLNKKALPEPSFSLAGANEYIAARNPFEQAIADIWGDILNLEKISVLDNFFEIGGHSLLATRVIAQIRQRFSIDIHLRELFDNPSIAELALQAQMLQGQQQNMPKLIAITEADRPERLPLSFAQQRLWFIDQLSPNTSVYNMPFAVRLQGDVNITALLQAFTQLVQRHESLRSRIISEKGQAWQIVDKLKDDAICPFYEVNDDEQEILNRASEFLLKPFNLADDKLMRAELLLQKNSGDFVLLVCMHHIISDGWSMDIFIRDLLTLYQANDKNLPSPLKPLAVQYADYAIWQKTYLNDDVLGKQTTYWKQQLAYCEVLELPIDYPRPAVLDNRGAQHHFNLPLKLSQQLRQLSQQQGCSLYMTLLASFKILLAKYCNQTDIAIGSPIANRPVAELEDMIGLFLNTLVLRSQVDDQQNFNSFLHDVKNTTLDAYQHQDLPFELLVDELNVSRDTSQTPLFQAMFILQSSSQAGFSELSNSEVNGIKLTALNENSTEQTAKFDITLNIIDTEAQLSAAIEYRSSLFSQSSMARMAEHLIGLLETIVDQPQQKIADISFVTEAEIQQQMDFEHGLNATDHQYPHVDALHLLIEKQVAKTPEATAIIYADTQLTYQQLNQQANLLAQKLIHSGLQIGEPVGLCVYRSEKMSIALLAILKAGAAYVPFDPDFPLERLNFMAKDTAIKVLITDVDIKNHRDINVKETILMSDAAQWQDYSDANINIEFSKDALFNIIYTSGSTGVPKGVMVPHQGIINRLQWMQKFYPLGTEDVVLQKTPYSFDVSVWELFWPLMQGSSLVFAERDGHKNPQYLSDIIQQHQVTTLHFVPSMLGIFLQLKDIKDCKSIKQVFCSGEALQLEHARQFYQQLKQAQLHNLYGPTEASIDVSFYHCVENETRRSIPIGKPIHNTQLHILDSSLNIVPTGVAGELYIGGTGLALGYLNRHDLTQQTFIENPYAKSHGHASKKLYKTGDVARYLSDGNIEYLGRTDHQIKVRGQRIELGEIESRLQQLEHVRESIVVAKSPDGDQTNMQLIAYCLLPKGQEELDHNQIKAKLKQDLPDYMLPSYFISLDKWPLSANGKINRKALPDPQWHESSQVYIAAATDLEKSLTAIWLDLLKVEKIGIQDNFFEIGGHSLLATRLTAEIASQFDIDLKVANIFDSPTIQSLAEFIENTELHSKALPAITPVSRDQNLPLSFNQQRLWFIYKLQPTAASYNIPTALKLNGHLDLKAFNKAVASIFQRHEILRTVIVEQGDEAYQQVLESIDNALSIETLNEADQLQDIIDDEAKRPFDLKTAPLIRLRLLQKEKQPEKNILLVTMHHIISDAVSLQNMVQELAIAYYGFKEQKPLTLPPLTVQYADYAWWQNNILAGDYLDEQLHYWQQQLADAPALLNLPTDNIRPAQQSNHGAIFNAQLSEATVNRVRSFAKQNHYTPFMLLLSAQQLLLGRLAGDTDVCIGVPIAGRHQKGTEDLIGFFVNALIIRSRFDHNPSVADFIHSVKQQVLAGFAHQDAPFEQVIERCKVKRSSAYNPIAQIGFNYITQQNQILSQLSNELAGISIEAIEQQITDAKYDMIWAFQDTLTDAENTFGSITINLEYNTDLFNATTVQHWFELYEQLINNMLSELEAPVLKLALNNQDQLLNCIKDNHATPQAIAEVRPLTAMQRDLYLDTVLTPDNRRNYFGWIHRIQHTLDVELFQQAIDIITRQFSSFRMRLVEPNKPYLELAYAAIIDKDHADSKIQVQHLDWSQDQLSSADFNTRCKEELAFKPYKLADEPLIRFIAIKETANSYAIVLTAHHSCIDGISLQTVTDAYTHSYAALLNKEDASAIQDSLVKDNYAAYVHQQNLTCDNGPSYEFWQQQSQGVEALTAATKALNSQAIKGNYFFKEYSDSAEHYAAIQQYCKDNNTTAFLYIKALYTLMLQSTCYADESFYFTDIIAARPKGHIAETGCYFEQRPTVIDASAVDKEASFTELLDYLNQQRIKVRGDTHISNSLQNRVFSQSNTQFMFNFYLTERYLPFLDGQSETTFIVPEMDDAVTFTTIVDGDHLLFNFTYTDNVFTDNNFVRRLLHLSQQVLAGNNQLAALQLHLAEEPIPLATAACEYNHSSVISMIEAQAHRNPNACAIIDCDAGLAEQTLSYSELNQKSNQLAHYLQQVQGIKQGDTVALCHAANSQFMIALLATLKCGAVYIPVDINYPIKRINYILEDSSARCILSESGMQETLKDIQANKVYLDSLSAEIQKHKTDNLNLTIDIDDLLYLIYTSGSTGLPKAAMVKQRGEINLIQWYIKEFTLNESDKVLISSATGFDLTQKNLLASLTAGSSIVFPNMQDYDPQLLLNTIQQQKITLSNCAPSAFYPVVEAAADENNNFKSLSSLRLMLFGGEAIRINSFIDWLQSPLTGCQLVNMYGPTECTDIASFYRIEEPANFINTAIPIGLANDNVQLFIADSSLRLLPAGFSGELLIGGEGIGAGYLNNEALTQTSFINHPIAGLVYRTGDLVQLQPDGNFVFINRIDHQVKIRGLRIELGEIEYALKDLSEVIDSLVLVNEEEKLCAYVLTDTGSKPENWRQTLALSLSDYMIPQQLIAMKSWPLTANGKIDRKGLPKANDEDQAHNTAYIAPRNETEQQLLTIWQEVLGQEIIGVNDNFFDLGGHSLLAAKAVTRIREHFQQDLPLREVFLSPTIAAIAELLEQGSNSEENNNSLLPMIEPANRDVYQGLYPLSFTQQRLWLIEQIQQASSMYNIPLALELTGAVNHSALNAALRALYQRHESLRTRIVIKDGSAYQQVSNDDLIIIEKTSEQVDSQVQSFLQQPFRLENQALFKVQIIHCAKDKTVLLLNKHHIISDGLSSNILLQDLASFYQAYSNQEKSNLAELPIQYIDYSIWQKEHLTNSVLQTQVDYWSGNLKQSQVLDLPFDYPRSANNSLQGSIVEFSLPEATSKKLIQLAKQESATPFMLLITAYYLLLSRYSGQYDINIGTAVANRPQSALENVIGFFVNTLVIRTDIEASENLTFKQLLTQVKHVCSEAYSHQDLPFERLLDDLDIERDLSHSPLFQAFFTLQTAAEISSQTLDINGTQINAYQANSVNSGNINTEAKFELSLSMLAVDGKLSGSFEYRTALFKPETIQRLAEHFVGLLNAIAADACVDIHQLDFISDNEKNQLLSKLNNEVIDTANQQNVHALFESQVETTPDATAVIHGDEKITYQQINNKINQLAAYLQQELAIKSNSPVALCLAPGIDFITAVFAVVKAGCSYIPLDIMYPDERLKYIIEDSGTGIVLCNQTQKDRLTALIQTHDINLINICADNNTIATHSVDNPANIISPDTAIYNIYTSGSTGKPKGVTVKHQGESNLIDWYIHEFNFCARDSFLIVSAIGFDLTQKNFFAPLCSGAAIVFPEDVLFDPERVRALINKEQISILNCAPSALYPLIDNKEYYAEIQSLRCVLLGGEPIHTATVNTWLSATEFNCELVNMYGPTECTDISTIYRIRSQADLEHAVIPIGKAIRGTQTLILDANLQLQAKGIVGELYISGVSLSAGYINNDAENQSSFIDNPFASGLMYKTGDLVRLKSDNNIEYIGRTDHQVKIRGLRIELGEIEQRLENIDGIEKALVLAVNTDDGEASLVAYYSFSEIGLFIEPKTLRLALATQLADYMLPAFYQPMDAWPLNANGKIDRKQLPEPRWKKSSRSDIVKAKNAIERKCVAIWLDVLKLEEVSTQDHFFQIGGHSLKAAQVVADLRKAFVIDISLRDMFDATTIIDLALLIEQKQQQGMVIPSIEKADRSQTLVLSYAQQRLWFLSQLDASSPAYNMPAAFRLKGQINTQALEQALNSIIQRHESLRSNFIKVEGEPQLIIHAERKMSLPIKKVGSEAQLQQCINDDAKESFSLESGPLLRAKLIQISANDHCLLLNMHHIISDGTSVQILIRELGSLYLSYLNGVGNTLPELDLHYTDYANWQRQWLQGDVLDEQINFWSQQLSGAPTLLQLPLDRPRPKVQSFNGGVYKTVIDSDLTESLRQLSMNNGCTLFMTCLAAYQTLLTKYSHQKDICVGIPLAGRSISGVENIIGFFINALIIRTDFSANLSVQELLANIKNTTLAAFAHEHVPIEMLLNELDVERNLSFTPLAQCAFNMLSASDDVLPEGINDILGDLNIELMEADTVVSKFDLQMNLLDIQEQGESKLSLSMEYNSDIFDESTISTMMTFYIEMLKTFTEAPETTLENITLGQFNLPTQYEKALPLTAMQRDIYLATLAQPDTLENSLGYAWDAPIAVDEALWEQTLIDISGLFDVLRADLIQNDVPYQDIAYLAVKPVSQHQIDFELLDWTEEKLSEDALQQRIKDFVVKPYDLESDSGISYRLIKIKEDHYWATCASHHLYLDGFAGAIHIALFAARYEQLYKGKQDFPEKDAKALSLHFDEFKMEDHFPDYLQQSRAEFDSIETLEYWRNKLQQCEGLQLSSPIIFEPSSDNDNGEAKLISQEIPVEHYKAVKKYCRQFAITPPLYFKCLYALLIQQYTRANADFVLTEFNAGRNKFNKGSIGCFYHTQPFCFTAESLSNTLEDLFKSSKKHQKASRKHLQISNLMLRQLLPESGVYFSYNYLMMPHHTYMLDQYFTGNRYTPNATGMVDLRVQADGDELCLWLAYNSSIFTDHQFLQRLLSLSEQLLGGDIEHTQQLQFILPEEENSNTNISNYDIDKIAHQLKPATVQQQLVHNRISSQVIKTPEATAVNCADKSLTYSQLERYSNALANQLIEQGLHSGDKIAIVLDRSIELIIAILASIKAGACYIPLDTAYPDERLQYIVNDAQAQFIIVHNQQQARFENSSAQLINIDNINFESNTSQTPQVDINGDDLLYMIYTSGSTGQPKGASVYHKSESNLLNWYCDEFDFNHTDKTLIISATGFDLTQKNFFALLTVGGTVVLPTGNDFDVNNIINTINTQQISQINCAPSAFYALLESAENLSLFNSLKNVFFGGEPIQIKRLRNWIESDNYSTNIINMYGPTECTDISTFHTVTADDAKRLLQEPLHNEIPLGKANAGIKLYVLNDQLQKVPDGLAGELCIAGISVGAGYWKKPELSQDVFVVNPYSNTEHDKVLYRTGDLVRIQDSKLYYIGRKDFQIKLRGLRIELGEIEQQIKALPGLMDCQVMLDNDQLLAFGLTQEKSIDNWREILAQQLPEYMLPAQLICIKQWPLTPNGKIDRKMLLQLERQTSDTQVSFIAPRTDMEKNLATLWQEVLGLGEIGVHENFFEAGGDSLSAVRLIARIELRFEVKLAVASLFGAQTIAQLAHVIHNQTDDWSPIVPIQPQGNKTPLFAVHALGAMVLSYEPLARTLGKDQPFYGIQAYGFEDEQTPFTDMDEMVTFYVDAIKQTQAQGPYQIIGHSFGGLIALEIAKQLINRGDKVQYLGLIDTYKPVKYVNMPLDDAFILKTFAEHNFGVVDIPLNALRVMKPELMITKVADKFNGIVSEDFIRAAINVIRGFQRMTMNYKAKPVDLPIHLYRPQDSLDNLKGKIKKLVLRGNADNLGWHKVTENLTVSKVEGDHHSLLNVDNVASIAKQLQQQLNDLSN
ncbi:MAG: amino acid adenylation domain-containing protein [Pseudomonadales bacterium]|nr:amino acid adenylation domain-containing protein [Pseudomonadales bacterium]